MKFAVFIIAWLACSIGVAEQTTDPAWASYRVWVRSGNSALGGSATGIAEDLVVTNVHVVGNRGARVEVLHPLSGRKWVGQAVAVDPAADVALIQIASADLDWVEIGDDPQPGQACTLYGYGGDSVLKRGVGRYVSAGESRGGGVPVWEAEVESISGDSGGGLFDESGRLTSVNWGGKGNAARSASTPASYVTRLLTRWRSGGQIAQQPIRQSPQRRGGRMPPKQPIQLQPKIPADPLARFDVDGFVRYLASKVKK